MRLVYGLSTGPWCRSPGEARGTYGPHGSFPPTKHTFRITPETQQALCMYPKGQRAQSLLGFWGYAKGVFLLGCPASRACRARLPDGTGLLQL